jgi:hypothetical protein
MGSPPRIDHLGLPPPEAPHLRFSPRRPGKRHHCGSSTEILADAPTGSPGTRPAIVPRPAAPLNHVVHPPKNVGPPSRSEDGHQGPSHLDPIGRDRSDVARQGPRALRAAWVLIFSNIPGSMPARLASPTRTRYIQSTDDRLMSLSTSWPSHRTHTGARSGRIRAREAVRNPADCRRPCEIPQIAGGWPGARPAVPHPCAPRSNDESGDAVHE